MPRKMNLDEPNWASKKQKDIYSKKVEMRPFLPEEVSLRNLSNKKVVRNGNTSGINKNDADMERFIDIIVKKM